MYVVSDLEKTDLCYNEPHYTDIHSSGGSMGYYLLTLIPLVEVKSCILLTLIPLVEVLEQTVLLINTSKILVPAQHQGHLLSLQILSITH